MADLLDKNSLNGVFTIIKRAIEKIIPRISSSEMSAQGVGVYYVYDLPGFMIVQNINGDMCTTWIKADEMLYNPLSANISNAMEYAALESDWVQNGLQLMQSFGGSNDTFLIPYAKPTGATGATGGLVTTDDKKKINDMPIFVACTEQEYEAMSSHDANTYYMILES